LLYKIPMHL